MKFKKLFTVTAKPEGSDDPGGWGVEVTPSKYLQKLPPQEAIAELQAYIDALKDILKHYRQTFSDADLDKPEHFEKMRQVAFELDVCESYFDFLVKNSKTIH